MAKQWDDLMKLLAQAHPEQLVRFLLKHPDVVYCGTQNTELKTRTIYPDLLYNVLVADHDALVHVEFQRRHDVTMSKRVWEYNVLANCTYGFPVYSFVLYLRPDDAIVEPPYQQRGPDGRLLHLFHFENIKLWQMQPQDLVHANLPGLLPLLPLTKDGAQHETIEEMITLLLETGQRDLLPLGYGFAALVLDHGAEQKWLQERFGRMHEILEESWAYREIMEKGFAVGLEMGIKEGMQQGIEQGIEKGIEKGIEQGMQQGEERGRAEALRFSITELVNNQFPELLELTQQVVARIKSAERLRALFGSLCRSQTIQDAKVVLMKIAPSDEPS